MNILQELKQYIDEYTMVYDPTDEEDWRLVINEVTAFIDVSSWKNWRKKYHCFSSLTHDKYSRPVKAKNTYLRFGRLDSEVHTFYIICHFHFPVSPFNSPNYFIVQQKHVQWQNFTATLFRLFSGCINKIVQIKLLQH